LLNVKLVKELFCRMYVRIRPCKFY